MIEFRDGFYADVRTEDRSRTVISYQAGILEEMKSQVERRAFLRVYDGKMWYYASVTDLNHLQKTLDGLYAAAAPNDQILDDPTVRRFERNRDTVLSFADCSVRDIPAKDKQALLLSYLPLLNEDKCVTMPSGSYLDRSSLFHFQSSLGADITYDYQTCGLSFSCDMAEGEKKFSGHWQKGATRFDELKGLTETIRAAMAEQTAFLRSSVPGCGYVPYDDEGTKARKNYLIKNGVLAGRLHSAQTAAALDEGLTGNARAIDCTFEPIVRMTTTYIEGGDLDFDQLIAPIKKGYYIKTIRHGSGMSTFTIAPSLAYEIVDGKLGRPVQISVLTGSVFETLGLIDGLTRDVQLLSFVTGGCGKMEQMNLPVGFGGPYVRVSSMNVQ